MKFYGLSPEEAVRTLNSDINAGLSNTEAANRQVLYGLNKLTAKNKQSAIKRFFMQFNDFMIIVLISAAAVSFAVSFLNGEKDFADPLIILMIVVLNAVLGFIQENRAERSLEALQKLSALTAKVLRDGKVSQVDSETLVPGDIIILEAGDLVPADSRLITSINMRAEEAALTGESIPVEKEAELILSDNGQISDKKNMVFSGCSISYGRAKAVVCYTGMQTEMGKIAGMLHDDEKPQTPLQKKLEQTGKVLGISALAICFIIFVMGLMRDIMPFQMFMTSVSLAVAAIPEGLPAIVTIMLAIGVQRMAKQNAIIRKLPAVETLGSASVICTDKTGTLTQNVMTVVETYSPLIDDKDYGREIIKLAALCNDSVLQEKGSDISVLGDPTETAIVRKAYVMGINKTEREKETPRVSEISFDSVRKCMTTLHRSGTGILVITKGAPDIIIDKCTTVATKEGISPLDKYIKHDIINKNSEMADKALRVLAVCTKNIKHLPHKVKEDEIEQDLTFIGLIGMIDPPREEATEAVRTCKTAGIRPVMVTGDHILTAKAIGAKLGILTERDKAMTGEELSRISQEDLTEIIDEYSVFARVSPEHKMRIVKAFQSKGRIVAMTGDGINDAPALKCADIGCAMGLTGTDVAKSAADMILTDDNFATIVEAIKNGRGIYQNIRKAVHFLLSSNIGEILTIFAAILLGWATPLLAIHLLWVNLVTDSLPAIALGLDPTEKDIMRRKPFDNEKSLFSDGLFARIVCEGIMIGLLALIAFSIGSVYFDSPGNHDIGRTMAFATLSISQLFHAFNMRSDKSLFEIGAFENHYLVLAFIAGVLLQISVIMIKPLSVLFKVTQLDLKQWLFVSALSFMPIIIVEIQKFSQQKGIKMVNYDYS